MMTGMKIKLTPEKINKVLPILINPLTSIANYSTTDEGDVETTEEEFGISMKEVIEMAHDDMIGKARNALTILDRL